MNLKTLQNLNKYFFKREENYILEIENVMSIKLSI